VPPARH
jgi:hypothetical protein